MDAFTYEFRMWSITEIRDLFEEAGFSKSLVYWEGFDEDGLGNGEFHATEMLMKCPSKYNESNHVLVNETGDSSS